MTTKSKTQKAKVEPKVQATKPVVETQPKVSTSEQKKSFKLPSFRNKIEKPNIYRLARHGGVDKQTGMRKYPVTYMIKAEELIYDAETDSERTIRYIPGETSIFKDKQSKESKLKEPIMFSNGQLMVDKTNPLLKKFMDMHNGNRSNPNRKRNKSISFYKLDTEINASKHVESSKSEIEAMHLALTMPIDRLVSYARVLGVNVNKSTDEIRWDMKILAQKDPKAFVAGMNNPTTVIKEVLFKAHECKIIDMDKGKVSWVMGDLKQMITHVPIGIKPVDKMVDFCLSEEGKPTYGEIKNRLSQFE